MRQVNEAGLEAAKRALAKAIYGTEDDWDEMTVEAMACIRAYLNTTAPDEEVAVLVAKLREPHYLGDVTKARLPEPAADLISLFRKERREAADDLEALNANTASLLGIIESQSATIRGLEGERDEAVNWSDIVDRHGTDGFDALAETWLSMEPIKRMHNAVASVFAKWANDELMGRFKAHMSNAMHTSFVEGCIVGVKAELVKTKESEARATSAERSLDEAANALEPFSALADTVEFTGADGVKVGGPDIVKALNQARDAFRKALGEHHG